MVRHRDLPVGSRQWANAIDDALNKVEHLESVVQRATKDLGLDYSHPLRQYNVNGAPSVQNPVQMKMSSMQDIEVPNVQDGDVLTWDGLKGRWVAGRYDGPAQPTNYGQNSGVHPDDPVDPPEDETTYTPADTWNQNEFAYNLITDPSVEAGVHPNWRVPSDRWVDDLNNQNTTPKYSNVVGGISQTSAMSMVGSSALQVELNAHVAVKNNPDPALWEQGKANWIVHDNIPLEAESFLVSLRVISSSQTAVYCGVHLDLMGGGDDYIHRIESKHIRVFKTGWSTFFISCPPEVRGGYGASKLRLLFALGADADLDLAGTKIGIDAVLAGVNTSSYFDGDHPSTPEYATSWAGAQNASVSTQTLYRRLCAPSVITLGKEFQVIGEGFNAGEAVTIWENSWGSTTVDVIADSTGRFDTRMTIPANTDPNVGPVAGEPTAGVYALSDIASARPPTVNATYVNA